MGPVAVAVEVLALFVGTQLAQAQVGAVQEEQPALLQEVAWQDTPHQVAYTVVDVDAGSVVMNMAGLACCGSMKFLSRRVK
jgi:hypothetical protein